MSFTIIVTIEGKKCARHKILKQIERITGDHLIKDEKGITTMMCDVVI